MIDGEVSVAAKVDVLAAVRSTAEPSAVTDAALESRFMAGASCRAARGASPRWDGAHRTCFCGAGSAGSREARRLYRCAASRRTVLFSWRPYNDGPEDAHAHADRPAVGDDPVQPHALRAAVR